MNPLEVPPDLAQLTRDGRYQQQQRGVVSASALPAGAHHRAHQRAADRARARWPATASRRTSTSAGSACPSRPSRCGRRSSASGRTWASRWSRTTPPAGVMETNWAENRAKLPQDIIRKTARLGARLGLLHRRDGPVPHARRAHRHRQRDLHHPQGHGRGATPRRRRTPPRWQPRPHRSAAGDRDAGAAAGQAGRRRRPRRALRSPTR